MTEKHANKKGQKKKHVAKETTVRMLLVVLISVFLLLNLFTFVVQIVRYNGEGMEPSLSQGQILVLLKTQKVEQGDVIAFYYNNQILVRRIVCEGGHQIIMDNAGNVSIDGQALEETYVKGLSKGQCNIIFPYYVQPDHVFVMGDNREIAMDSRLSEIGVIPNSRIIGKVLFAF